MNIPTVDQYSEVSEGAVSRRTAVAVAAAFSILTGFMTIVVLQVTHRADPLTAWIVGGSSVVVGVVIWVAPWDRWTRSTLYVLIPIAFTLKAVSSLTSDIDPFTYGIHFALIFTWIGVSFRPGTCLRWAPVSAITYLLPLFAAESGASDIAGMATVLPISIAIGEAVGIVLRRMRRAEQSASYRTAAMFRLVRATSSMAGEEDTRGIVTLLAELAVDVLEVPAALVFAGKPSGVMRAAAVRGFVGDLATMRIAPGEFLVIESALLSGEPTLEEPGLQGSLGAHVGAAQVLVVPFTGDIGVRGAVVAAWQPGRDLDEFVAGVAREFGQQASRTLARIRNTQLLREESLRDELTGLGNRRMGMGELRTLQSGDSVAILDLDHFKQVNDTMGHQAGDAVLAALGRYLAEAVRDGDNVSRYGGEEFMLILRAGPTGSSDGAIDRLIEGWRATKPVVTFSAGVAKHAANLSPAITLRYADAALYKAKHDGRDCVRRHGAYVDITEPPPFREAKSDMSDLPTDADARSFEKLHDAVDALFPVR